MDAVLSIDAPVGGAGAAVSHPRRWAPAGPTAGTPMLVAGLIGALSIVGLLSYPLLPAWLGLAVLLALAAVRWRIAGRPLPPSPFTLPIGLYLAGGLVGLAVSFRPSMAEIRIFGLLAACGTFFLLVDLVRSARAGQQVVAGALLVTTAAAPLLAIVVGPYLRTDRLPGLDPGLIGGLVAGFNPLREPIQEADAIMQRYRLRSSGLGLLGAYGIGLALGPLFAGPTRRARLLAGLAIGYFGLFVLLAAHRQSLITAGLLVVLFGALHHRRRGALLLGSVAAVAALAWISGRWSAWAADWILGPLPATATDLGPLAVRRELWGNALYLLGDYAFTGVGLGIRSSRTVFGDSFAMVDTGLRHGHNHYVQTYLEQGLLGLVGFVAISLLALAVGGRTLGRARDPSVCSVAISGCAAALAALLIGLTEIGATTTVGGVLLLGALGLVAATSRLGEPPAPVASTVRTAPRPGWPRIVAAGSGRLLGAGLALAVALGTLISALLPASPPGTLARGGLAAFHLNLANLSLTRAVLGEEYGPRRPEHLPTAERFFQQARLIDPHNLRVYRGLARLELARGRHERVRNWLREAETHTDPDDNRGWFQIGRLYREIEDLDRALAAWSKVDRTYNAWSCSSKDIQLLQWAERLARESRWPRVERTARASIEATPIYPRAYDLLATAVAQQGGPEAAVLALTRLAEAQPNVPWPHLRLAELHRGLGQTAEAAARVRMASELEESGRWRAERQRHLIRDCAEYLDGAGRSGAPGAGLPPG